MGSQGPFGSFHSITLIYQQFNTTYLSISKHRLRNNRAEHTSHVVKRLVPYPTRQRRLSQLIRSLESIDALVACIKADPLLPRPNPTATFWQEPPHPTVASIQSQELPSKTDIAIIGSGITGCSVAKALLEDPSLAGKTVTILEAREVTSSATGRNGGHLVSDCLESFGMVSATLGTDYAVEVARFSLASMQRLRDVVAAFGGDLAEKSKIREVVSTSVLGDEESLEEARVTLAAFEEALPDLKGMFVLLGKEEAMEVRYNLGMTECYPQLLHRLIRMVPMNRNITTATYSVLWNNMVLVHYGHIE